MSRRKENVPADMADPVAGSDRPTPRCPLMRPERLVGVCFRHGLAGLETGHRCLWELAWQEFANAAGPAAASDLLGELLGFVQSVKLAAERPIQTLPPACPGLCRDECLAVAMVAAGQHRVCPALKACAFTLLGSSNVRRPLAAAETFGDRLRDVEQILSPDSICNAASWIPAEGQRPC